MFFRSDQPHGLPHNPFNAIVVPRPIGWISSLSADGRVNLAPYSFFNAVAYTPPQVMFSASGRHDQGGPKDSVANIEATGEFVVNLATWALRTQMNASSIAAPHGVDEFEVAGLTKAGSTLVVPPRVAESPVHLECRYVQSVKLLSNDPSNVGTVIFGEVLGIHIDDSVLSDGLVDMTKLQPIGRLGYMDYVKVTEVFTMQRPKWPDDAPAKVRESVS
ncbi:MAG: flavin reductase family protein [Kiloniellales bacterium]